MNTLLSPIKIFKINLYLILLLLCANVLGKASVYYFEYDGAHRWFRLFNFNAEQNVPTLYSSIALGFVSIQTAYIAFICKKSKLSYIPWFGLSIIFLFLSIDEMFKIHERLEIPMRDIFETSGLLYFAWVIPYGIALVVFIIAYSKFLFNLPRDIMILFLISGATFVSGAIGFELISGRYVSLYGDNNVTYFSMTTCEELLEMLGIALFIYTLFLYMVKQFESISITLAKKS